GKIAAGKSTLSAKLAQAERTLDISEDHWIEQLYGPELKTLADYFERCERLRAALAPHVVGLLRAGVSVVLDFHANTVRSRRWMRALFEEAGASHQLHFLDVPDARSAAGGWRQRRRIRPCHQFLRPARARRSVQRSSAWRRVTAAL